MAVPHMAEPGRPHQPSLSMALEVRAARGGDEASHLGPASTQQNRQRLVCSESYKPSVTFPGPDPTLEETFCESMNSCGGACLSCPAWGTPARNAAQ